MTGTTETAVAPVLAPRLRPGLRPVAVVRVPSERISRSGYLLIFCTLLLAASAWASLRIRIGVFRVHPLNAGILPLLFFIVPFRVRVVPRPIIWSLVMFFVGFGLSSMLENNGMPLTVKLLTAIATALVAATAVRSEADFRAAGAGLVVAAFVMGLRGVGAEQLQSSGGANPLEGISNKNGYSLYALPALMMGVHLVLRTSSRWFRLLLAVASMGIIFVLFSTANRSGWLGAMVIAGLSGFDTLRRGRKTMIWIAIIAVSGYLAYRYGNTVMIDQKLRQTEEGYLSDNIRKELAKTSFEVFTEHPLVGASPQYLPFILARRVLITTRAIEAHNAFALLLGGGGLLVIIPFLLLSFYLWRRPPGLAQDPPESPRREAHGLLRSMMIVWAVRAMFTAEILYSPAFALALGLIVGVCVLRGVWRAPPAPAPITRAPRVIPPRAVLA